MSVGASEGRANRAWQVGRWSEASRMPKPPSRSGGPAVDGRGRPGYTSGTGILRRRELLLIGFVWVFVGLAALVLAKPFSPGLWEDSGPAAMMAACMGAFLAGSVVVLAM